jgi:hypothetical protein
VVPMVLTKPSAPKAKQMSSPKPSKAARAK